MYPSPSETALLVMDIQPEVVPLYDGDTIMGNIRTAIDAARKAGALVVYVTLSLRSGFPEVSPRNRIFAPLSQMIDAIAGDVHPDLEPQPGEVRVAKKRMGAFNGSDLEMVLRSRGVTSLALAGISTSGVVLSTLQHASDLDYRIAVLSDCCKDSDEAVHGFLLERIFPTHADVLTAHEWADALGASARQAN